MPLLRLSRAHAALALLAAAILAGACGSADPRAATAARTLRTTASTGGVVDAAVPEPALGTATPEITPAPAGPGKASFIAFADSVCTRFRSDLTRLDRAKRASDLAYHARHLSDLFGFAVDRLTAKPRPRQDRAALGDYLLRLADQRALLARLADASERKDAAAADDINRQVDDVSAAAHVLARNYGLLVCGS
jgi:hypothetical protein